MPVNGWFSTFIPKTILQAAPFKANLSQPQKTNLKRTVLK
jgi:hypothetical protein